jgi:hypothetical protein
MADDQQLLLPVLSLLRRPGDQTLPLPVPSLLLLLVLPLLRCPPCSSSSRCSPPPMPKRPRAPPPCAPLLLLLRRRSGDQWLHLLRRPAPLAPAPPPPDAPLAPVTLMISFCNQQNCAQMTSALFRQLCESFFFRFCSRL